jgi:hypothetical protein
LADNKTVYTDATYVRIHGDKISVEVPARLLPPTGEMITLDLYGYDFWTSQSGFKPFSFFPRMNDATVRMKAFKR